MCAMPESSFGKGLAYPSIPSCDDTELRTQAHFSGLHSEGAFDWTNEFKGLLTALSNEAPFSVSAAQLLYLVCNELPCPGWYLRFC